jgi:hypothetical protein
VEDLMERESGAVWDDRALLAHRCQKAWLGLVADARNRQAEVLGLVADALFEGDGAEAVRIGRRHGIEMRLIRAIEEVYDLPRA